MQLKRLAKRVADARGLEHTRNLIVLRQYIKSTSESSLLEQVEKFDSVRLCRILWEAGLSANMQQAVISQIEEIS